MTRLVHVLRDFVAVAFLFLAIHVVAAPPALVPLPQILVQTNAGMFTLCPSQYVPGISTPAPTKILVDDNSRENGEYLAALLLKSTGFRFEIATNNSPFPIPQAILLTTNTALTNLGAEGYEMTVAPNSVVIRAPTQAGIFYGMQSLLQLLPPEILSTRPITNVLWKAQCVYIQDLPRFPWRGWMLDSVRHFFNKDEVKLMIDSMTINKLNVMHWHLDDDSGWRIEIKKWPLLTQTGAWRSWTNQGGTNLWGLNARSTTAYNDVGLYGGYYSQADIREIVAYAAQRHITIVPEIEMPGHSTAALSAYPQFSCNGTNNDCLSCSNVPYTLSNTSYPGGVFCIARPETMSFLQDVLTEVMDLFPSQYIHIGGDEVLFGNWSKHSLDKALTNSLGLTNLSSQTAMRRYQGYFTQQIANWVKGKGRQMIGWSEIYNGGAVTNAAVMDWLNTSATQAATNGEYAVMAVSQTLYINKWEDATIGSGNSGGSPVIWSNEPPAQGASAPFVTLPNVYAYEPVPVGLSAAFTNFILGCEGPAWSEWIPSLKNLQFRVFPRLCAIAEVGWTPTEYKNYTDFTNRMLIHKQRLTQLGINYNSGITPPAVGTWDGFLFPTTNYVTLQWNVTTSVTNFGEIDLSFAWKSGTSGLNIAWVALVENGVEIDRDTHAGYTGNGSPLTVQPVYVLRLPAYRFGNVYTLRASVAPQGGTNSSGVIYRPNWN